MTRILKTSLLDFNEFLDEELSRLVAGDGTVKRLYQIMEYHFGRLDEDLRRRCGANPGKRLRPSLSFLVCEAAGGDGKAALPGALAVELVHEFSLVHDDVQAGSRLRRDRPAVWSLWGIAHGVNVGDGLFALAHLALSEARLDPAIACRSVGILGRACVALCEGQFLDLVMQADPAGGIDDYRTMIGGKTGALFGCAAELGAILAGAPDETVGGFGRFGRALGVAFQMQDDLLGVWGEAAVTGKAPSDVRDHKRGLPAVLAWERADEVALRRLDRLYRRQGVLGDDEVQWVLELYRRLGVPEQAAAVTREQFAEARRALSEVTVNDGAIGEFVENLVRVVAPAIPRDR